MSRWESGAREKLQRAAFELFVERGFSSVSVPEIAERAGLTNRTFYRHFGDKREVLFAAEADFPSRVSEAISGIPEWDSLVDVLRYGLDNAASVFANAQRGDLRARRAIINSDAALQERELAKQAALTAAMNSGFTSLGFAELQSRLAAEIASAIFTVALNQWLDQNSEQTFQDVVRFTVELASSITTTATPPTSGVPAGSADSAALPPAELVHHTAKQR
jgi:AcrR family transcriptional regulator